MPEPFIGELRMFAGMFAPRGWATCDGQLLSIAQNEALFSLLGTTYGGDGQTTFALPDLRGRIPLHAGQGPGLSSRRLGQQVGTEVVALSAAQLGGHSHRWPAATDRAASSSPEGGVVAAASTEAYARRPPDAQLRNDPTDPSTGGIGPAGGGQPHPNLQPYLCVQFIIALTGIFPSRS